MTREAKLLINMWDILHRERHKVITEENYDVIQKAINAVEQERSRSAEITQYRHDCEKLMEENERLKKALEQEPKYCDRNICLKNEYNGIGCDECEVTKSQEPKTGHWIEDEYEMEVRCSICGEENDECSRYCPNCGAKMESEG